MTVFEIENKHFYCYFRLNDRQWYMNNGLKMQIVSRVKNPVILKLKEKLGFLVYISNKYVSNQDFNKQSKHFKEINESNMKTKNWVLALNQVKKRTRPMTHRTLCRNC